MANYGPASAYLLIGGRNISSDTFTLTEGVESKVTQSNGIGSTMEAHKPIGVGMTTLEAAGGFYDNTVDGIMTALQAKGETRQLVAYGFEGATTGQSCTMIDGDYATNWKRIAEREDLTKAHAVHKISGEYKTGKILHGLTAETASSGDTTTPSVDNGAATTGGATFDAHVTALTLGGALSLTLKGLHSTDDVTYSTAVTFTNTTGITAERKTATGTIGQYTAMSWLFNASTSGAPSGNTVTPFVAVSRG